MKHALLQAWQKTLHRCGEKRAIVQAVDGQGATFRELDERASAWLTAHTSEPPSLRGRAVVFAAANGIGWFEIFLGLLKAGSVVVPLDAAEPASAQRTLAESLRAGFWWDGTRLVPLAGAKRFRDPDICLIKLTSGSTGRPRPLVFTAGQLIADGKQVMATMAIKPHDLNYALIPLGHSYGLGNLTIPLLAQGVPLICGAAALPHAIAADFVRWRPTVFPAVPALWRAVAGSDVVLASLRLGISAGAPLPPEVARNFVARFGRRLHSFYGSSETGGIAYDSTGQVTLQGGVGRAINGVKLQMMAGGRLQVSSAAVTTYGNRARVEKLGAWIMADAVRWEDRSGLWLLGRRGSSVKIAGRRVNLAEIGARLRRLTGVEDVWVAVSQNAEPVLGAAVVSSRSAGELRTELLTDTAAWKVPKKLVVLAALPLTARGKVDASAARARVFGDAT